MIGPQLHYPLIAESPYATPDALPESCAKMHRALGIENTVMVGPGGYGRSYDYMLHVLELMGNAVRGVIVPPTTFSHSELNMLNAAGVRGIRFASDSAGPHVARIEEDLARLVYDVGWHVQFILGAVTLTSTSIGCSRCRTPSSSITSGECPLPTVRSRRRWAGLLKMLDTGRVWVKLSGAMYLSSFDLPYSDVRPLADVLVRHAPERLLWGTDWPHLHMGDKSMPNDADLLDLLLDWVPDEATRTRILVENPRTLYGF